MIKLTLPKMAEVSREPLDVFEKYGTQAAITDFVILFGGYVSDLVVKNGIDLKDRTGLYYAISEKTGSYNGVIHEDGHAHWGINRDADEIGFRLVSKFSKLSK